MLSVEVQTLSVCNDRTDNEKAAVIAAGVPEAQVFPVPYTGEALSAQDAAGPVITANPEITNWIVFGCNDEGVLGTLNALATAGVNPETSLASAWALTKPASRGLPGSRAASRPACSSPAWMLARLQRPVLYDAVVNGKAPEASSYRPDLHRRCNQLHRRHGSDFVGELL